MEEVKQVKQLCSFFLEGTCKNGTKCQYLHSNSLSSKSVKICRYYSNGNCGRGKQCKFLHPTQSRKSTKPTVIRQKVHTGSFIVTAPLIPTPPTATPLLSTTISTFFGAPGAFSTSSDSNVWNAQKKNIKTTKSTTSTTFFGAPGAFSTSSDSNVWNAQEKNINKSTTSTFNYSKIVEAEQKATQHQPQPTTTQNTLIATKKLPCKFHALGYCRRGNTCTLSHEIELDSQVTAVVLESATKTCGICFDQVHPKRFGLMMNCDCIYCLDCVRQWRTNNDGSIDSDNVRRCPICRVPSFFIIPCNRHPTGFNKQTVVAEYLLNLKLTPCSHFAQNGTCPFGSSCFYQHKNSEGLVDSTIPRLKKSANGTLSNFETHTISDFIQLE